VPRVEWGLSLQPAVGVHQQKLRTVAEQGPLRAAREESGALVQRGGKRRGRAKRANNAGPSGAGAGHYNSKQQDSSWLQGATRSNAHANQPQALCHV
jgi:hypothetical protein